MDFKQLPYNKRRRIGMESEQNRWQIAILLQSFLTITACPPRWKAFDLYLIRDEQVVFYVGQSVCAFNRVWEHLKGGPHGHSIVGRFLLCNWPRSGRFTVELLRSQGPRFTDAGSLDAAERMLIEAYRPCFNVALNGLPFPLPEEFLPPNVPIKHLKNLRRMMREAGYAVRKNSEDSEW
jgi:hypothetical protein